MEEPEKTPPSTESCRISKKGFLAPVLFSLVVVGGAGLAAYFYCPPSFFAPSRAVNTTKMDALEQRLNLLETQIKDLDKAVPAAPNAENAAPMGDEIRKLKEQVETQGAQSQQTAEKKIAAAFAFWDLKDAVKTGGPFVLQLSALRNAAADDAATIDLATKLEPYAVSGVLTVSALAAALLEEEKKAPLPENEAKSASFFARARAIFLPLISIRPLHDPRFADIEKALSANDAGAALAATQALPEDVQKNMEEWTSHLQARIAVDTLLNALTERFTKAPLQRN